MDINIALQNTIKATPKLAVDELEFIREHKDEAIPVLIERVKKVIDLNGDVPEDFDEHFYAMFLLGELKVKEAFKYLIKYLELDDGIVDFLIGDSITESYHKVLAAVAVSDDIPEIKKIAENRKLDIFHRLCAVNTLVTMYIQDVYPREELCSYLEFLIKQTDDDETFRTFVMSDAFDILAENTYDLIRKCFDDNLIDKSIFDRDDFENYIAEHDLESALAEKNNYGRYDYIDNTIEFLSTWHYFNTKPDYKKELGRKIGRNEPCPCGSGKKYKKCCGENE